MASKLLLAAVFTYGSLANPLYLSAPTGPTHGGSPTPSIVTPKPPIASDPIEASVITPKSPVVTSPTTISPIDLLPPTPTISDDCSTRTVCIDGVNSCGQGWGTCIPDCRPWSYTTPPCSTFVPPPECNNLEDGRTELWLCKDFVDPCGHMWGGCYDVCAQPEPEWHPPPCDLEWPPHEVVDPPQNGPIDTDPFGPPPITNPLEFPPSIPNPPIISPPKPSPT